MYLAFGATLVADLGRGLVLGVLVLFSTVLGIDAAEESPNLTTALAVESPNLTAVLPEELLNLTAVLGEDELAKVGIALLPPPNVGIALDDAPPEPKTTGLQ